MDVADWQNYLRFLLSIYRIFLISVDFRRRQLLLILIYYTLPLLVARGRTNGRSYHFEMDGGGAELVLLCELGGGVGAAGLGAATVHDPWITLFLQSVFLRSYWRYLLRYLSGLSNLRTSPIITSQAQA